jgi:hypothetical protein
MLRHTFIAIASLVPGSFASLAGAQTCAPFTDVAAASGFCTNIQWLHNRGVTQGCTTTTYCPAPATTASPQATARANYAGCFVYADVSNPSDTSCFAQSEIVIRGLGGFYFWTAGHSDATYSGARLATGTGARAAYSDRNGKERIEPVDPGAVLDKLVAMPIATWQWKSEPGAVRHKRQAAEIAALREALTTLLRSLDTQQSFSAHAP